MIIEGYVKLVSRYVNKFSQLKPCLEMSGVSYQGLLH